MSHCQVFLYQNWWPLFDGGEMRKEYMYVVFIRLASKRVCVITHANVQYEWELDLLANVDNMVVTSEYVWLKRCLHEMMAFL